MTFFGSLTTIKSSPGTVAFSCVLIFLLIFEGFLHIVEKYSAKYGLDGLVQKLYREFMIMGFVSFGIFIGTSGSQIGPDSNQYFQAFEFAHLVIFFIALAFILQAFLLVLLVSARKQTLLKFSASQSHDLLAEYDEMPKLQHCFFHNGPLVIAFPKLRENIEFKIIQEFFASSFNLPAEFNFANYMCKLLQNYVINLVDVRPINWLILAGLVVLNYARIKAINNVFEDKTCRELVAQNSTGNTLFSGEVHHSRYLTSSGENTANQTPICVNFLLRYIAFDVCAFMLYQICILIASQIYMQRLLGKVLDREERIEHQQQDEAKQEREREEESNVEESSFEFGDVYANLPEKIKSTLANDASGPRNSQLASQKVTRQSLYNQASVDEEPVDAPVVIRRKKPALQIETQSAAQTQEEKKQDLNCIEEGRGGGGAVPRLSLNTPSPRPALFRSISKSSIGSDGAAKSPKQARRDSLSSLRFELEVARIGRKVQKNTVERRKTLLSSLNQTAGRRHMYRNALERIYLSELAHKCYVLQSSRGKSSGGDGDGNGGDGDRSSRRLSISSLSLAGVEKRPSLLEPQSPGADASKRQSRRRLSSDASELSTSGRGNERRGADTFSFKNSTRHRVNSVDFSAVKSDDGAEGSGKTITMVTAVLPWIWQKICGLVNWLVKTLMHHPGDAPKGSHSDDAAIEEIQQFLATIFLWNNSQAYFHAVELGLLLQCLYVALWATNFVQLGLRSDHPIEWELILITPIIVNFRILRKILYIACMLKSISVLDTDVAEKICEDAIDERHVRVKLRETIRNMLRDNVKDKKDWHSYLENCYMDFVFESATYPLRGCNRMEFYAFLHSIHIFLSKASVERIFKVIDFDEDGFLTWNDLDNIVFPELAKQDRKKRHKKEKAEKDNGGVGNSLPKPLARLSTLALRRPTFANPLKSFVGLMRLDSNQNVGSPGTTLAATEEEAAADDKSNSDSDSDNGSESEGDSAFSCDSKKSDHSNSSSTSLDCTLEKFVRPIAAVSEVTTSLGLEEKMLDI